MHATEAELALLVLVERYGMDGKGARSLEHVARRIRRAPSTVRRLEGEALRSLTKRAAEIRARLREARRGRG